MSDVEFGGIPVFSAAAPADIPLSRRDSRAAERIGQRTLARFRENELSVAVQAGRFGIFNTFHKPQVYESVAEQLLATEERAEISVHRIYWNASYPHRGADVISARTMKDWPKYLPKDPVHHPEVFVKSGGRLEVEQLYPPEA